LLDVHQIAVINKDEKTMRTTPSRPVANRAPGFCMVALP
jgi:hypothetical protein